MKIIKVEWWDTFVLNAWLDKEDADAAMPVRIASVGYLYKEDKTAIRLAGMIAPKDKDANAIQVIPKGCIISRKELKEV